jgi:uncharacterized protein YndB with AHSA1/START domain
MLAPFTDGRRSVMATQASRANALKHDIVVEATRDSGASPEAVYEVLADPSTHLVWGGERHTKGARLVDVRAEDGPLTVGSEFTSTGRDLMGTFEDRSVVTEADPGRVLEFVTEARLTTKKGRIADWTLIHRYAIEPAGAGSTVTYTVRTTRISALPGPMRLLNVPLLSGLLMHEAAKGPRNGLANLLRMAEERARA